MGWWWRFRLPGDLSRKIVCYRGAEIMDEQSPKVTLVCSFQESSSESLTSVRTA